MAVKIRLQQTGKRNARSYRIVVMDESQKRDGHAIDLIGFYDPQATEKLKFDAAKIDSWTKKGAVMTTAVSKLIKK